MANEVKSDRTSKAKTLAVYISRSAVFQHQKNPEAFTLRQVMSCIFLKAVNHPGSLPSTVSAVKAHLTVSTHVLAHNEIKAVRLGFQLAEPATRTATGATPHIKAKRHTDTVQRSASHYNDNDKNLR
jgi:hypothetical protein